MSSSVWYISVSKKKLEFKKYPSKQKNKKTIKKSQKPTSSSKKLLINLILASSLIFFLNVVSAAPINDTFHINLQTTYANGSIETGTFTFAFNITESSSSSCGTPIVYNHSTSQTTDTRGIVSLYLPTTGSGGGNLSTLDYDIQYYLCYYRDGTFKNVSQLGRVPYAFRATQVNLSEISVDSNLNMTDQYNITDVDYGFFQFLGSLIERITKIFATDADISNNLDVGGDVNVTGDVFSQNKNLTFSYDYAINSTGTAGIGDCPSGQFVQNTTTGGVECTAPAGGGDITGVYGDDIYIYNGSSSGEITLVLNETKLNETIDLRGNDTTYSAGTGLTLTGTTFAFNETYGNATYILQSNEANLNVNSSQFLDTYNSTFFMPLNTSVYGTFDFNGGWTSGGLSIDGGDLYAQTVYVYNITSLNVTEQDLTIIDDLIVYGNTELKQNLTVDTDTLFINSNNDRVGIGTVNPDIPLVVKSSGSGTGIKLWDSSWQDDEYNGIGIYGAAIDSELGSIGYRYKIDGGSNSGLQLGTGGTDHVTILTSGNVGIGTTSPGAPLHVNGTDQTARFTGSTSLYNSYFNTTGAIGYVGSGNALINDGSFGDFAIRAEDDLRFAIGTSEKLTILNNGNVGIGISNPAAKLHVNGSAVINGTLNMDSNKIISLGNGTSAQDAVTLSQLQAVNTTGNLTGGGAANRAAFWTDSDTLSYDGNFTWDNTNKRLGIGTNSPDSQLTVSNPSHSQIEIETTGDDDARLLFDVEGVSNWIMGLDNSDSDKFKINTGTSLNTNNALTINVDGKVGIGTTSPGKKLEIYTNAGGTVDLLRLRNYNASAASTVGILFEGYDQQGAIRVNRTNVDTGTDMTFHTDDTSGVLQERVRITELGKVGIGTTSPIAYEAIATKLHVDGGGSAGTISEVARFEGASDGEDSAGIIRLGTSNDWGVFIEGGRDATGGYGKIGITDYQGDKTESIYIQTDGDVGIGTTSPSELLHLSSSSNTTQIIQAVPNNDSTLKLLETGTGDVGAYLRYDGGNNRLGLFVGNNPPTEKLTILRDSANVGIGVTNPLNLFHVEGSANEGILMKSTGADSVPSIQIENDAKQWKFKVDGTKADAFIIRETGAGDWLTVETGGQVGIGTTSPGSLLHINTTQASITALIESSALTGALLLSPQLKLNGTGVTDAHLDIDRGHTGRMAVTTYSSSGVIDWITGTYYNGGSAQSNFGIGVGKYPANQTFVIEPDGDIGINTTTPQNTLNVVGDLNVTGTIYGLGGANVSGNVTGAGTTNTITKWTGSGTLGDSLITDDGTIVAVDTSDLYINTTSGNVGIGTSSPNQKLEVVGTNHMIWLDSSQNVYSVIDRGSSNRRGVLTFVTAGNSSETIPITGFNWGVGVADSDDAGDGSEFFIGSNTHGADAKLWIETSGNVGIGTTSPGGKLSVNGSILVHEDGAVSDNDSIRFTGGRANIGYDGSNYVGYLQGGTAKGVGLRVNGSSTDSLRIDTSGNVGIGTTSPQEELHVYRAADNAAIEIEVADGSQAHLKLTNSEGSGWIYEDGNSLRFFQNSATRMTIDPDGNVGIGTTSPQQRLHVNGSAVINGTLNMDSNKIISLGNGTSAQDAVTLSQLQIVNASGNVTGAGAVNRTAFWIGSTTLSYDGNFTWDNTNKRLGIGTTSPNYTFSIGSTDASDQIGIYHDNTNAYFRWDDGVLYLQTDEGTNTDSYVNIKGKGTGYGRLNIYDEDNAEYMQIRSYSGVGSIDMMGTAPGVLHLNRYSNTSILAFSSTTANPYFSIYGYKTGVGTKVGSFTVNSAGNLEIHSSSGQGIAFKPGGTLMAFFEETQARFYDDIPVGFGDSLDYSAGYQNSTDTFQIVDGSTLGSNVRFLIDNTGKVGIGTAAPQQKLHVNGSAVINGTLNMDSNKIISLGNGTSAQDAVTLSQLQAVNTTGNITGGGTTNTITKWTGSGALGDSLITDDGTIVAVDSSDLYINTTSGNVGIGTTTPNAIFHLVDGSGELTIKKHVSNSTTIGTNTTSGSDTDAIFLSSHLDGLTAGRGAWIGLYGADHVSAPSRLRLNTDTGGNIEMLGGNVGIGVSTPDNLLHVYNGNSTGSSYTTADLTIEDDENAVIQFLSPNTALQGFLFGDPESNIIGQITYSHPANTLTLSAATGANAMILNSSGDVTIVGDVGIGTTSPQTLLEIASKSLGTGWEDTDLDSATSIVGVDAGLNIVSEDTATWGSAIHLKQVNGTTFENVWSIGRQTNWNGTGDGTLRFIYGTDKRGLRNTGTVMTLQTGGNVGIGISPVDILHISESGNADNYNASSITEGVNLRIENPGNNWNNVVGLIFNNSGAATGNGVAKIGAEIQAASDADLFFQVSDNGVVSEAMRILANGNVGINTTSPLDTLDVEGSARFTRSGVATQYLQFTENAVTTEGHLIEAFGTKDIQIRTPSGRGIFLMPGANVGINTTTPQNTLNVVGDGNFTGDIFSQNNNLTLGYDYALNSTGTAGIGDCPSGQFVQNTTTGGVECDAPSGAGDITAVYTTLDNYLYNGSASGDVYLRFNETFAGLNLAVNSSDFWDNLDTPADISGSDITNDLSWINTSGETDPLWTGNQSLYYLKSNPFGFWNDTYATFNETYADTLYYGLSNPYGYYNSTSPQTETDPLWTGNQSSYYNKTYVYNVTEIDAFSLSHWTDDLGNRGYTHLTNFTDDILWTSGFNATGDSRWLGVGAETDPYWTGNYSGLTSGQVLFGQLEQDGNLTWDDTNKRLGIGTTSPDTNLQIESTGHAQTYITTTDGASVAKLQLQNSADATYGTMALTNDGKLHIGAADSSSTDHLVILPTTGNVGIGTTSPGKKLDLNVSSGDGLRIYSSGQPVIFLDNQATNGAEFELRSLVHGTTGVLGIFNDSDTEILTIEDSGDVGIGDTTPDAKLDVAGTFRVDSTSTYGNTLTVDGGSVWTWASGYGGILKTTGATVLGFGTNNNNDVMVINGSNVGIGATSPTHKLHLNESSGGLNYLKFTNTDTGSGVSDGSIVGLTADETLLVGNLEAGDVQLSAYGKTLTLKGDTGNIGIGTTSPLRKLDVEGNVEINDSIYGKSTDHTYYQIAPISDGTYPHKFFTRTDVGASLERFRIEGGAETSNILMLNSNVGIGTAAPQQRLHVNGSAVINGTLNMDSNKVISLGNGTSAQDAVTLSQLQAVNTTGNLTGGGAANRAAFWTGSDTLSYDGNFTWNNTNKRLGIGTNSPLQELHVIDDIRVEDPAFGRYIELRTSGAARQDIVADKGPQASSDMGFVVDGTARIFIDGSTGNVGIGTSSPSEKLQVEGNIYLNGSNPNLYFNNTNTGAVAGFIQNVNTSGINYLRFYEDGYGMALHSNAGLSIGTNYVATQSPADGLIVEGDVGIGTASPAAKLDVKSSGTDTAFTMGTASDGSLLSQFYETGGGAVIFSLFDASANEKIRFRTDGSDNYINAGNVGIGTTSPSTILSINGSDDANQGQIVIIDKDQPSTNVASKAFVTGYGSDISGATGKLWYMGSASATSHSVALANSIANGSLFLVTAGTGNIHLSAGGTEKLSILSDGKVGIGLTNPARDLQVQTATNPTISARDSTSSIDTIFGSDNSQGFVGTLTSHNLDIRTNNTARIKVLSDGKVGIGTTTPQQRLHVNGLTVINGTLNMDSNKIISLGNGTSAQDAVTLSQLQAVNTTGNLTGTGAANRAAFWTGSDTLSYDGNFTWDNTNKRLGIGTTSPDKKLDVEGTLEINHTSPTIYFTDQTDGDDSYQLYVNSGNFQLYNTNDSRYDLTVDGSGNVGIGTTSPTSLLHLNDSADINLTLDRQGWVGGETSNIRFRHGNNDNYMARIGSWVEGAGSNVALRFYTSTGGAEYERMVIRGSGNVGINTTTPQNTLNVVGDANITGLIYGNGSQLTDVGGTPGGTEGAIQFYDGGDLGGNASQFFINKTSGEVGIGTAYPTQLLTIGGLVQLNRGSNNDGIIFGSDSRIFSAGANLFAIGDYTSANKHLVVNTSSGNVGIGTTSPSVNLHIDSASDTTQIIEANPNNDSTLKLLEQGTGDVGAYLRYNGANNRFGIFVGNNPPTEKLTILRDSDYVGIGTTSPGAKLDISGSGNLLRIGNSTNTAHYASFRADGASGAFIGYDGAQALFQSGSGKAMEFRVNGSTYNTGTVAMFIDADGDIGIGTISPSNELEIIGSDTLLHLDSTGNIYSVLDRAASNRRGALVFLTAGDPTQTIPTTGFNWGVGVADSDNAGDGTEFFIGGNTDGSSAKFWIETDGKVGINTTTPQNLLNVIGDANFTGLIYGNGSQLTDVGSSPGGTEGAIQFYDGGDLGGNASQFFINKTSGNVGIGTTSPTYKLDIRDATNPIMSIIDTTNNVAFFAEALDDAVLVGEIGGSYPFHLWVGGGAKMSILTSGNVGINTTTPQNTLNVVGDANITGLIYGNGSQLTGISTTETDPLWTGNQSSYSTTATILGWNYYNDTNFPYTSLTNFTDDLGDRGYTSLTNFTDDILWTSGFNSTGDSRWLGVGGETDPLWTGNQSSYSTTATILGWSYYNSTDFSISDYYLKNNPFGFYNSTNPQTETDPLWTGNQSLYVRRNTWTDINDYPTGCGAGTAVRIIDDTLTCIDVGQVTDVWVNESGDTMSGDLDLGDNDLENVGTVYHDDTTRYLSRVTSDGTDGGTLHNIGSFWNTTDNYLRFRGYTGVALDVQTTNVLTSTTSAMTIIPNLALSGTLDMNSNNIQDIGNLYTDDSSTNFFSQSCTYGIQSISSAGTVTCASQQGTGNGTVTSVATGTGIGGGTITTSGTLTVAGGTCLDADTDGLSVTAAGCKTDWDAAYTHVTTDVIETVANVQAVAVGGDLSGTVGSASVDNNKCTTDQVLEGDGTCVTNYESGDDGDSNIGNEYPIAGDDIDVSTRTVNIESTLDYVTTINNFFDTACTSGQGARGVSTTGGYSCQDFEEETHASDHAGACLTAATDSLSVDNLCVNAATTDGYSLDQNVLITSGPTFGGLTLNGNLDMNNKSIVDVWKVTLNVGGAIDPPYRVGDTVYSTYAPFMVGVKEEVTGTVKLNSSYIIDFKNLGIGSDLWLFYQVTDFGGNWENLQVILTPNFSGNVWYEKNPQAKTLTIHGSQTGEVSYRLTANGWNWRGWSNVAKDLNLNDYLDMGEKK